MSTTPIDYNGGNFIHQPISINQPAKYFIRLGVQIDSERTGWFEGMEIHLGESQTILEGVLQDQSALFGLLMRIRDLGIPLISVSRLEPGDEEPSEN